MCFSIAICTAEASWGASVLIQKFLASLDVHVEGAAAEALDGGEDVVGGLDPAEGTRIGVAGVDEGLNGHHKFADRSVGAALDLFFRQERKETLDLVDPGGGGRREVGVPVGPLRERSTGMLHSTSSRNLRAVLESIVEAGFSDYQKLASR